MARFFVDMPLKVGDCVDLPANVVRHIHVLRLRPDESIVLFNGDGTRYRATWQALDKRHAQAIISDAMPSASESPLHITLIQAISSGERMDFTLQKSVELGVNRIIPVSSERSIVKLSGERADKRQQRWQDIVISACEQCGRDVVPEVQEIQTLRQALQQMPSADLKLLMSLNHAKSLQTFEPPKQVVFMVGPEGGWTQAEEQLAMDAGFQAILLGKRILRTETAALASIAAMQTLWGDFA